MSATEMDLYLVSGQDTGLSTTDVDLYVVQQEAVVDAKEPETVEVILDRPEPCRTKFVARVVGCVLLLSIIPSMLGVLTYLIISGESMMDDSRDLVMPVDVMAISRPTTVYGGCGKGGCTILYAITVRYTFNNQTKEERYTSFTLHFPGDNFTITISTSSGNPLRSEESKLYLDGFARQTAGVVCIIIFVCCPPFCPCIIMCAMKCAEDHSKSKPRPKSKPKSKPTTSKTGPLSSQV